MSKILICASMASHIENFHRPYISEYKKRGHTVHVCVDGFNGEDMGGADRIIKLPYVKKTYSPINAFTVLRLARIIRREKYDLISTQASLAGIIGRAAAVLSGRKCKIVHTCHGYLFNDDGSRRTKFYLFMEKLFRKRTDLLLTMNKSDLAIAEKYKLGKTVQLINGMGFNNSGFDEISTETLTEMRRRLGIEPNETVYVSVGEFSERKNQQMIIRAFAEMPERLSAKLILAGMGDKLDFCRELAETLGIGERVIFTYRCSRINLLLRLSDCFVTASVFEGLPFCVMEALYCSLPVIASDVKGNSDLVNESNGILFGIDDTDALAAALDTLTAAPCALQKLKSGAALDEKYLLKNAEKTNFSFYMPL